MATAELPQYELYVAGGNSAPASGRFYETVDPYTGQPWARVRTRARRTWTARWQPPAPRSRASGARSPGSSARG